MPIENPALPSRPSRRHALKTFASLAAAGGLGGALLAGCSREEGGKTASAGGARPW